MDKKSLKILQRDYILVTKNTNNQQSLTLKFAYARIKMNIEKIKKEEKR